MKFDGHVKLTSQAVLKMKQKCPVTTGSCSAPMFQDDMRAWFGDGQTSKPSDNYTSAILNYITNAVTPDKISTVKLPDAVAFVDIDERWTHDDPKGQRFHFMKAKGELNIAAYNNAREFIHVHTSNWVDSARKIMIFESQMYKEKVVRPLQSYGLGLTNHYVKELALALHSLQDSFSPGHTNRYMGMKKSINQTVIIKNHMNKGLVMPIRDIHICGSKP